MLIFGLTLLAVLANTGAEFSCPSVSDETKVFADSAQCDLYWECRNGQSKRKVCPDGLVFHPEKNAGEDPCDLVSNVPDKCSQRTERQRASPGDASCPRQNGVYPSPDPTECDVFFSCLKGKGSPTKCAVGLHFSTELGICVWPRESGRNSCVSAEERYERKQKADAKDPTKQKPQSLNGFTCPGGKLGVHPALPHPSNCRKYYICQNGLIPEEAGCTKGRVFNPKKQQCDEPENVRGCEDHYNPKKKEVSSDNGLSVDLDPKDVAKLFSLLSGVLKDGVDLNDVLGGGGEHQPSGGAPSRGHSGGPPRGHPGVNLPVRAGGGKLGGRPGFGGGRRPGRPGRPGRRPGRPAVRFDYDYDFDDIKPQRKKQKMKTTTTTPSTTTTTPTTRTLDNTKSRITSLFPGNRRKPGQIVGKAQPKLGDIKPSVRKNEVKTEQVRRPVRPVAVELSPQEAEDLFNSIYREAAPMDASIREAAPVDASILKAAPVVTTTPPPPPTVPQTERPVATRRPVLDVRRPKLTLFSNNRRQRPSLTVTEALPEEELTTTLPLTSPSIIKSLKGKRPSFSFADRRRLSGSFSQPTVRDEAIRSTLATTELPLDTTTERRGFFHPRPRSHIFGPKPTPPSQPRQEAAELTVEAVQTADPDLKFKKVVQTTDLVTDSPIFTRFKGFAATPAAVRREKMNTMEKLFHQGHPDPPSADRTAQLASGFNPVTPANPLSGSMPKVNLNGQSVQSFPAVPRQGARPLFPQGVQSFPAVPQQAARPVLEPIITSAALPRLVQPVGFSSGAATSPSFDVQPVADRSRQRIRIDSFRQQEEEEAPVITRVQDNVHRGRSRIHKRPRLNNNGVSQGQRVRVSSVESGSDLESLETLEPIAPSRGHFVEKSAQAAEPLFNRGRLVATVDPANSARRRVQPASTFSDDRRRVQPDSSFSDDRRRVQPNLNFSDDRHRVEPNTFSGSSRPRTRLDSAPTFQADQPAFLQSRQLSPAVDSQPSFFQSSFSQPEQSSPFQAKQTSFQSSFSGTEHRSPFQTAIQNIPTQFSRPVSPQSSRSDSLEPVRSSEARILMGSGLKSSLSSLIQSGTAENTGHAIEILRAKHNSAENKHRARG